MSLKTIKELTAELDKFPDDYTWCPYEAEVLGINIYNKKDDAVGFINIEKNVATDFFDDMTND